MKNLLTLVLLIFSLNAPAQNQASENEKTRLEYETADKELNQVYQKILNDYKADKKFIANMKTAQRAWMAFRDAELKALYPAQDGRLEYGSAFPMCWNIALIELTRERTKQLKKWTEGIPEGDVCAGSVKRADR